MKIRTGKFEAEIPNWVVVTGVYMLDNVVANICKTKVLTDKRKSFSSFKKKGS